MRAYPKDSGNKNNMEIIRNYTAAPGPITPPIERNLDLPTPRQINPGENQVNPESHYTPNWAMYNLPGNLFPIETPA